MQIVYHWLLIRCFLPRNMHEKNPWKMRRLVPALRPRNVYRVQTGPQIRRWRNLCQTVPRPRHLLWHFPPKVPKLWVIRRKRHETPSSGRKSARTTIYHQLPFSNPIYFTRRQSFMCDVWAQRKGCRDQNCQYNSHKQCGRIDASPQYETCDYAWSRVY